jgi:hypothetical protein
MKRRTRGDKQGIIVIVSLLVKVTLYSMRIYNTEINFEIITATHSFESSTLNERSLTEFNIYTGEFGIYN